MKEILFDVLIATVISSILFLAKYVLVNSEIYNYLLYILICILTYLGIIKLLSYSYKKTYSQINLINPFSYRQDSVLFNHYLLPILLIFVLPLYLFFSNHYQSDLIICFLSFVIYFLYFTNLRAFFKNNYKVEHKTHFIYDVLNILNYFFSLYVLLSFVGYFGIQRGFELVFLIILEIFFYFICFTRYYERIIKKLFIIGLTLICFNFLIILVFNFPILKILILTIGSYINFILFNRKYLQQDYKLDKGDYKESLLIQIFSLGFALII